MNELDELAAELVSIPSHDDETAAGERIADWLDAETAASVRIDEAGNVIARRGSGDRSLALVGHHDVVPPDESQVASETLDGADEYVVERRDGRLHGRGSADMKGAVAAAMLAFRDADPSGELVFASFAGEEQGGVGAQAAIESGFCPEYAVVGEGSTGYSAPGVTDVAVAHKGRRASTVRASGQSAHASNPSEGENAIYRACDAVDELRALDVPTVEVAGEELSGSLVATEVEGGTAWNVVPDACEVTVDERTVPGERAPIERVESISGVGVEIEQDLPPMRCGDDAFAETVLDAAAEAQDAAPELVTKPHATDAGWLSQAGTTCVVCGPAEPGEAHTEDESVSLAVLERCYELYRGVAERWPAV
ncbi:acetylornithine deacetylase [Natronoarchaeum philippinense]|uniref:Acetylornithine deacetylase n=1 Tax=Natronoarchaeum philippinense TaxID=558529 RepID=A0A285P2P5_NATPI|nr:M20/M25/M40 family metallo-hydrolase [Natronoarchaeum philippinense]SNZ16002.1 acetylornithine deacetylase [Natronoarchaeum philippinense]